MTTRIAILASGAGTNAQALIRAAEQGGLGDASVVAVLADREEAGALRVGSAAGVEAVFVDPAQAPDRAAYGEVLIGELASRAVDLVCLAGFMRILSPGFIAAFEGRVVNIHPALLPAFPGAHAVADALAWGVKVSGTTVHFADEAVDHGPIIAQVCVPVSDDDDEERLHARIKAVEHDLYPAVVRLIVEGRVRRRGRRVTVAAAGAAMPVGSQG